jgi:hypothetical protein
LQLILQELPGLLACSGSACALLVRSVKLLVPGRIVVGLAKRAGKLLRGFLEMTNEDFEKRVEFILEQQVQFTVDMQQLRKSQAQTDQVVNRLAAVTLEGFKDVNTKIDALVDSQMRLQDSHARLAESQAQRDESLKNLIAVVDRYFSKGNNGKTEEKN